MRLAYEQGLLRGRSISPYQRWALEYHMSYKRWFIREVQDSALKDLLWVLDPERFRKLYITSEIDEDVEEEGVPMDGEDIDDIERWLRETERPRAITASQLPDNEGWI